MSFAVIKTGGKQYCVKVGELLKVEKLEGAVGDKVAFDQVLLIVDGENVELGQPVLAGQIVDAEIILQDKERTVRVEKFKSKVRYHRVYGHRQPFTKVRILSIAGKTEVDKKAVKKTTGPKQTAPKMAIKKPTKKVATKTTKKTVKKTK